MPSLTRDPSFMASMEPGRPQPVAWVTVQAQGELREVVAPNGEAILGRGEPRGFGGSQKILEKFWVMWKFVDFDSFILIIYI